MASLLPVVDDIPPLDSALLNLSQEESAFLKALTRIQDVDELKRHVLEVQEKAYKVYCYPCIRLFGFTKLTISRLPAYAEAMKLSKSRPGAILLDAGCCFGNDLRQAVKDGWPVKNAIGTDLQADFWKYGHELFKSSPDTFPAGFVAGSIFDDKLVQPRDVLYGKPSTNRPTDLQELKSLTPLQGHVSVIHISSVFHLFDEERQASLAKRLASLLSPQPGSVIFGRHGGLPQKGLRYDLPDHPMFCHDPESWKSLWGEQVFEKGTVRVEVELRLVEDRSVKIFRQEEDSKFYFLVWSVTRL
ncbi:hypothetical protein NP233_g9729 [Leucocoprinus birnbaumii]|uniref:Methyltransferase ausD n=1 Tax=Leucocoprinus birnbaumii TaxID=56174 RepID=A0AAD5YLY9_9AGAR|nr:hypothetical protein NP233_g9729 [Leucocoprinus birnbaumii]